MPNYIMLMSWTQKGIEDVKSSPARLTKAKAAVKQAGGRIKQFFMTLGPYDMVAVVEAPDDETFARTALSIASQGGVRSQTLKAFAEDEYRRIIKSL